MAQNDNTGIIDLRKILRDLLAHKKLFFKVWAVTFVVSCLLIICVPRYYSTTAKLAPELSGSDLGSGTIGSIASSFGFDLGEMQSNDAISPLLYPDLMEDNAFVARLFHVRIKTIDGKIDTDYATYLLKHQKTAWWNKVKSWLTNLFGSEESSERGGGDEGQFDPYQLSKQDDNIAAAIRGNITLDFDKKNGVITILSRAQDPLVCKMMADTVQVYLQEYITEYRTKKARVDVDHYQQLCNEALEEYNQARLAYAAFADANLNAVQQRVASKIGDLENNMQLKYTTYTTLNTQLQASKVKVQEKTPAFTVLKGADVPLKPAGPKRMRFVILMLFLASAIVGARIYLKS